MWIGLLLASNWCKSNASKYLLLSLLGGDQIAIPDIKITIPWVRMPTPIPVLWEIKYINNTYPYPCIDDNQIHSLMWMIPTPIPQLGDSNTCIEFSNSMYWLYINSVNLPSHTGWQWMFLVVLAFHAWRCVLSHVCTTCNGDFTQVLCVSCSFDPVWALLFLFILLNDMVCCHLWLSKDSLVYACAWMDLFDITHWRFRCSLCIWTSDMGLTTLTTCKSLFLVMYTIKA
jgi:hypothetical protein